VGNLSVNEAIYIIIETLKQENNHLSYMQNFGLIIDEDLIKEFFMNEPEKFESWAIVELFGHQQIAGKVSEQIIAGQGFMRVDVPGVGDAAPFTRLFGPGAIYAITPTTEEITKLYIGNLKPEPIQPYMLRASLPEELRTDEQIQWEQDEDDRRREEDEEQSEIQF
jgi:hypothetical protein